MATIYGTNGADLCDGTAGDDTIYGWPADGDENSDLGNDTLNGLAGADLINGGGGDDSLTGGDGYNNLNGGAGNDTLVGGDSVLSGGYAENLFGAEGDDSIVGGAGDDDLIGSSGNDTLLGGDGNDLLESGSGVDHVDGGPGADIWYGDFTEETVPFILAWNPGPTDTVTFPDGTTATAIERPILYLGSGDDRVSLSGRGQIVGGDGDDSLTAGTTGSELTGGPGDDTLVGGDGNDQLGVVFTTLPFIVPPAPLPDGGNDLIFGGGGIDYLDGGLGDDTLDGGAGDDYIFGGGGNDRFSGGDGTDYLFGQSGPGFATFVAQHFPGTLDHVHLRPGAGGDIVDLTALTAGFSGFTPGTDPFAADYLRFVQSGADALLQVDTDAAGGAVSFQTIMRLIGVSAASPTADNFTGGAVPFAVLAGDDGPNGLRGTAGADHIDAFGGDDVVEAEAGDDRVRAGAGNDRVNAYDGNDTVLGGDGSDTLFGSLGDDTLMGDAGTDFLAGGDGDDSLDGGTGADMVIGGVGNDTLTGGTDLDWDRLVGLADGSRDVFLMAAPGAQSVGAYDSVERFDPEFHRIDVRATRAHGLGDLVFSDYPGAGIKIIAPGGTAFLVNGQGFADVSADWFFFVA